MSRLTSATALALNVGSLSQLADRRVDDSSSREQLDRRRAQWMAAAQAGDRVAYERVLADSVALIRAVARRQGAPADLLDDVVQETLLSVHRVRHTYDPARSYDAWLAALAARRAIDLLRRQGRHDARELPMAEGWEPAGEESVDERAAQAQRAGRLRRAIAELPPGQRQAVEAALKEQSLAETAAATGRTPGALKVNLHRALKALRVRLGKGE